MPPWSRMWVSARVSSSRVVTPGRTAAWSSSRVRPTSSPAVRMPASCSGVLPSQRSRLNRPMPRNPTGAQPSPPHPPTPVEAARRTSEDARQFLRARRSAACQLSTAAQVGVAQSRPTRHGGRMDERLAMVAAAQDGVLSSTDAAGWASRRSSSTAWSVPVRSSGSGGGPTSCAPSTRRRTRRLATACGPSHPADPAARSAGGPRAPGPRRRTSPRPGTVGGERPDARG